MAGEDGNSSDHTAWWDQEFELDPEDDEEQVKDFKLEAGHTGLGECLKNRGEDSCQGVYGEADMDIITLGSYCWVRRLAEAWNIG